MKASPPIPVRIEWAESQGRVTASWLTAHFDFRQLEANRLATHKKCKILSLRYVGRLNCPLPLLKVSFQSLRLINYGRPAQTR